MSVSLHTRPKDVGNIFLVSCVKVTKGYLRSPCFFANNFLQNEDMHSRAPGLIVFISQDASNGTLLPILT